MGLEALFTKGLRVTSPEIAREYGLNLDAPVFLSGYVNGNELPCGECHTEYNPLIYQVGVVTDAEHMCNNNGGIYHNICPPISLDNCARGDLGNYAYHWVAIVNPLGIHSVQGNVGRSESVFISQIKAFCGVCTDPKELRSGVVYSDDLPSDKRLTRDVRLLPLCDPKIHPEYQNKIQLAFQNFGSGGVLFRPL